MFRDICLVWGFRDNKLSASFSGSELLKAMPYISQSIVKIRYTRVIALHSNRIDFHGGALCALFGKHG